MKQKGGTGRPNARDFLSLTSIRPQQALFPTSVDSSRGDLTSKPYFSLRFSRENSGRDLVRN